MVCLVLASSLQAQSTATLRGRISDPSDSVLAGASIAIRNLGNGDERTTRTDGAGLYQVAALAAGRYRIEVQAQGFRAQVIDERSVEVAKIVSQDFRLEVGDIAAQVQVVSSSSLVDLSMVSVGQVLDEQTIQDLPLNGLHFFDLGLLIPGSVTPPQNGFLSAPFRGQGTFALNTAGNREDTVNVQINGINLNDQVNNLLNFQPPNSSIREFKIDNSTFSAEFGRNSGAVVNIATRSGTNDWHGEVSEFFRNDALDARNFFNFNSKNPSPLKRNQFGGAIGGPIVKNKAFFFFAYEGLRQNQGIDLNSLVLSDTERASGSDDVVRKLIDLIPRSNFVDSSGTSRFIGSARAVVDLDQWTADVSTNLTANDRLHGYYAIQRDNRNEPNLQGSTIPGFGDVRLGRRQIFTLNESHVFGPSLVNEMRFGFNRILSDLRPAAKLNPADFGINNGIDQPIGLPELRISGGGLTFGGPSIFPSVRGDTTFVASDGLSFLRGRHSLKFGGEFRSFLNNSFMLDPGTFVFPSVAAFLADNANSFSITHGDRSVSIWQGALGLFVQDNFRWKPGLTLDLGLRYEWNMSPTERYDRFIVFDPARAALLRVGTDVDQVYKTNAQNIEPRLGFAWDPFGDQKTSVRAAYAILVEQPVTNAVTNLAANPPLAIPLTVTGSIRMDNAISVAKAGGLAPITVDHGLRNSYVQSWNFNIQRALTGKLSVMIGYFGSKGTHLRLTRNINQPVNGVRPFSALSASSPILPGTLLGNITQVEGSGNSSYNAGWLTLNSRVTRRLNFSASYTLSKSLDYNSSTSPPTAVTVQDSFNLRGDRGLSDFDARHRLSANLIYDLPFQGNRWVEGWQAGLITQLQSGNPVNIVTSNSTLTGISNTVRPNVNGPVKTIGTPDLWFDTSTFSAVSNFGTLGRNVVIGPGFNNTDFSIIKTTTFEKSVRIQFRTEVFNLFNHPNFGQPGRVVGSSSFGKITNTRFPAGDMGSSRQIQFVTKIIF